MNSPIRLVLAGLTVSLAANAGAASQDFVAQVLAHNPQIEAQRQAATAAAAAIGPAAALDDPILSYTLAPESLGVAGLDTGYSVTLTQTVPWPGKRQQQRDAARHAAQAVQEGLQLTGRDLVLQTRRLLADWQYLQAAVQINQQQKRILQSAVSSAKARYAAAAQSPQILLAADLQQREREASLLELQRRKTQLLASLNALRGRTADSALGVPDELHWPALTAAENALSEHPALQQLNARQAQAVAQQRQSELAWRPDMQFSASYQTTVAREENRARVGLALNLPFATEKRRQQILQSQSRRAQLKAQVHDALLQLQRDEAAARAALSAAQQRQTLLHSQWLPLARRNLAAAQSDYASGRGEFMAISEAEQALLRARLEAAAAQRDELNAQAKLLWLYGQEEISGRYGVEQ